MIPGLGQVTQDEYPVVTEGKEMLRKNNPPTLLGVSVGANGHSSKWPKLEHFEQENKAFWIITPNIKSIFMSPYCYQQMSTLIMGERDRSNMLKTPIKLCTRSTVRKGSLTPSFRVGWAQ